MQPYATVPSRHTIHLTKIYFNAIWDPIRIGFFSQGGNDAFSVILCVPSSSISGRGVAIVNGVRKRPYVSILLLLCNAASLPHSFELTFRFNLHNLNGPHMCVHVYLYTVLMVAHTDPAITSQVLTAADCTPGLRKAYKP